MTDHAAPPTEFGTGLRTRIEHGRGLESRVAPTPSRDLVRLCSDERAETPPGPRTLLSRDLAVRGPSGAFAA